MIIFVSILFSTCMSFEIYIEQKYIYLYPTLLERGRSIYK